MRAGKEAFINPKELERNAIRKYDKEFLNVTFPDWLKSTKETQDFRGYVIDKHTILEHFIDLLLIAHFFGDINAPLAEPFKDSLLNTIDFAKKVKAIETLGLINKETKGRIFRVNDYRLAQVHIKKDDPLRQPTPENWTQFKECSTKAHADIASKIMIADANLRGKIIEMIKK